MKLIAFPLLVMATAAQPADQVTVATAMPITRTAAIPADLPVELMVMREVSGRAARPGVRFALETVKPVIVDGKIVIPAGATAWGEVIAAEAAGRSGRGGRIAVRLLYVEIGGERVPLSGSAAAEARNATRTVSALSASIGPFAWLAKGNDARIKAGETMTGFVIGMRDRATVANRFVLAAHTPVVLETLSSLSSETLAGGDRVPLVLAEPIMIDGIDVVPAGARAFGEVVRADRKGAFGVAGSLGIALLYIDAGGVVVMLDGAERWDGRGLPARGLSGSAFAAAAGVAVTGRSIIVPAGTRLTGTVRRDTALPSP